MYIVYSATRKCRDIPCDLVGHFGNVVFVFVFVFFFFRKEYTKSLTNPDTLNKTRGLCSHHFLTCFEISLCTWYDYTWPLIKTITPKALLNEDDISYWMKHSFFEKEWLSQLTELPNATAIPIAYQESTWWRHQMETFSALLAFCTGNPLVTGEFPAQRPVTRSFEVFFGLRLNERLSKQSWGWWFETPSRPLWRHCNGIKYLGLVPTPCIIFL